ncbi:hypothetical protein AVEN_57028-1 [Araneus ventricosus]|uniref:Uncharacterized protein n=1 Tax=Araneus ventricosus TaxID=182803 RepID=A0A4Y2N7Z8_ARAVE|nr:hypothetical protein AVEN_57028-1 [Araneus ventricosus]
MRLQLTKGARLTKGWLQFHGPKNARNKSRNLEGRDSDFSIFSNHSISNLSHLPSSHLKPPRPAPMRRGRKVKSQGFVGLLTATTNLISLSHLIIGRESKPKGFLWWHSGRSSISVWSGCPPVA